MCLFHPVVNWFGYARAKTDALGDVTGTLPWTVEARQLSPTQEITVEPRAGGRGELPATIE